MKLIKNYLYNAFYQVFVLFVPLITMPYVSRTLGASGAGINAFTNSNTQYFVLIATLGVTLYGNRQTAYTRDDSKKLSQTFWEIFIMQIITTIISLASFYLFVFFSGNYKAEYLAQSILIVSVAFDISWFFMGLEKFKLTVTRNFIIKFASLFLIFTFVKNEGDLLKYIIILSLSQLLGNLSLFPYLKHYVQKIYFPIHLMQHLKVSLVFFVPQIAITFYTILNKVLVGKIVSVEASGYFDYSDKIVKVILAIVTATGTVMLPRVSNTFAKGNFKKVEKYLYLTFSCVSMISFPMMFGLAAIATKFVPFFFGREFLPVLPLMMMESVVIVIIAWENVLGGQYLIPIGRNTSYNIAIILGAVFSILFSIPLIKSLGTMGAIVATTFSEVTVLLYELFCIKDNIILKVLFRETWKFFVSGLIMFLVVYYLNLLWSLNVFSMIAEILIGIVIYLIMLKVLNTYILSFLQKKFKNSIKQ